jgi:cobalt-zinc-cadmium efflux system outer membrane protein
MIGTATLVLALTAASASPTLSAFAGIAPRAAADAAVAASPEVAAARAHVAEMQALVDAAQRAGGPSLTAAQTNAPQGGPNGGTVEQSLTTLGGAYTFTDAYQHGPAVAQARAAVRVAESDLADAQRKERVKTIDLYYDALRALADVQAQRLFVGAARSDEDAARIRFRAGDAPRLDVVRAQVDLSRASAALDAAVTGADNALDALSSETGIERARFESVVPTALEPLPSADGAALVQTALARRTDILSARAAVVAAQASIAVAERSGAPAVTVSAGYTQGVDAGEFVRGPSAALQVGVPLGRPSRAVAEAERRRVDQVQLRVTQLERDVRLEVSTALRSALAAARSVRGALDAQSAADDELRAVETGYANGASSSLDVAEARRIADQATVDTIAARYAQARADAQLFEVIGS